MRYFTFTYEIKGRNSGFVSGTAGVQCASDFDAEHAAQQIRREYEAQHGPLPAAATVSIPQHKECTEYEYMEMYL